MYRYFRTRHLPEIPKQLVDNKTIYDFLNKVTTSDSLNLKLCSTIIGQDYIQYFADKGEALKIVHDAKLFTKQDAEFIYQQSLYSPRFKLAKQHIKIEKNILIPDTCYIYSNDKEYWKNIRKQYGSLCSMSMPLFSVDLNTAIIKYSFSCGSLCGYGGFYVYRKTNGVWKLMGGS